jgi:hypothetical protein
MVMMPTTMKTTSLALALTCFVAGEALAQQAPEQLAVAMYAPAAAFADSSSRLAYIQGLARAIQQKAGVPTSGKIYVRLGDLLAAKPDFAIIDGQCLAAHAPGAILAAAVAGGDTAQAWGLYTRGDSLAALKGKKLVYVKTGCRDADFLDNAMLDGELKTAGYFGAVVDKTDVAGAVATVRDYKAADAVFAPAGQTRGLGKVYDAGSVPNAGFVALGTFAAPLVESVKQAVLGYGGGGGIDGWRAAPPTLYSGLTGRLGGRAKRPVFAAPDPVRLDDQDVLVVPTSRYEQAPVKQHFWEPAGGAE